MACLPSECGRSTDHGTISMPCQYMFTAKKRRTSTCCTHLLSNQRFGMASSESVEERFAEECTNAVSGRLRSTGTRIPEPNGPECMVIRIRSNLGRGAYVCGPGEPSLSGLQMMPQRRSGYTSRIDERAAAAI